MCHRAICPFIAINFKHTGEDRNLKDNNVSMPVFFFNENLCLETRSEPPRGGKGSPVAAGGGQPAAQSGPGTCWAFSKAVTGKMAAD